MAMSVFLDYGVPRALQGLVLDPVMFLLYTSDLVEFFHSFGLLAHAYADDLQINAQSASLRSLVAAESILQQPNAASKGPPTFLCGF